MLVNQCNVPFHTLDSKFMSVGQNLRDVREGLGEKLSFSVLKQSA